MVNFQADPLKALQPLIGSGTSYWLNLAIGMLVSTIVSGIILVIVIQVMKRKWSMDVKIINTFTMVLVASIIFYLGLIGFISPLIVAMPMASVVIYALPVLVWVLLAFMFFRQMPFLAMVIFAVLGYVITTFVSPQLVVYVLAYAPHF